MNFFTYFNSNNNKELIFQISAQTANFSPFYRLFKFLYKSRALTYVVDAICDLFTKYL